ncbi:phage baseplate plug family protein [Fluviispira vulneris]|uniref:phage baseplate plug family protein n=1 Tax=Fluviispira vulneris TaxID=2763012 RepID=UPI00164895A9|nr:hypothetical protein [Fluviispira vulneris]
MTTFLIPVLTNNHYFEISVPLDGIVYNLEFYWNIRAQRFFLSLYDSNNNLIISSVPIILNFPLFYQYKNSNLPKGFLYAVDTTGKSIPPKLEDFGTRVQLYYDGVI